ncbi:MAG: patatin-like phospholipase family protein [Candidatus Aminicenantia bacterium]
MIKKKVGLALSGGAVLGFAHLGVIKVLEEYKIPISCVAGTSVGSLVGAFLAAGFSFKEIKEISEELSWGKISRLTFPRKGLLDGRLLKKFIEKKTGKKYFSELQIPFAAIAVDIKTGREVSLTEGNFVEAVQASCAIPGIFTPLNKDGKVLIDGGLRNFVPVNICRQFGADFVIAVKLIPSLNPERKVDNIIQILINTHDLIVREIAEKTPGGDINIVPNLEGFNSYDFSQAEELILRGEEAARKVIFSIEKYVRKILFWERVRRIIFFKK